MSSPHKTIRVLQILSAAGILISVVLMLDYFDVIQLPRLTAPEQHLSGLDTPKKIKRPTISRSATVQQLMDQGSQLMFDRQYEDAIKAYQAAAEKMPKDSTIYEKIGDAYFAQRKHDLARVQYEMAQKLAPQNEDLFIKHLRTIIGLRKPIDVRAILDRTTTDTPRVTYYKGLIAAFYNEREQAEDNFKKALELGDIPLQKKVQLFANLYKEFDIAQGASNTFLQVQLALAFDHVGEYGLAIELAFNTIKAQGDYRDAYTILGHAFLSEYRWFDAEDALSKVISLDSTSSTGYFFRGVARVQLNKPRDAINDFLKAIETGYRPKIAVEDQLAGLYYALNDLPHAYQYYRHIVETDPSDIKRFIRPIALAIGPLNKPLEAKELSARALAAHPNDAMGYNLVGWAQLSNNELAEARASFEKALTINPELPALHFNIGQLEERIGGREKALAAYGKAIAFAKKYNDPGIAYDAEVRRDALLSTPLGTSVLGTNGVPTYNGSTVPPTSIPSLSLE